MTGLEALTAKFDSLTRGLGKLAIDARRILIITHIDADGLASGSIVFASLMRKGANVTLRSVSDLDAKLIGEIEAQKYDFYIFTDLASTLITELEAALDGRFLAIDHHQIARRTRASPPWSTHGTSGSTEGPRPAHRRWHTSLRHRSIQPTGTFPRSRLWGPWRTGRTVARDAR